MFRLADPTETYPTPVTIEVPAADGKTAPQTLICHFRLLPADEIQPLFKDDQAFLSGILGDWEAIEDHTGKPLAFNPKNIARLSRIGYFTRGVVDGYLRFVAGLPAKN